MRLISKTTSVNRINSNLAQSQQGSGLVNQVRGTMTFNTGHEQRRESAGKPQKILAAWNAAEIATATRSLHSRCMSYGETSDRQRCFRRQALIPDRGAGRYEIPVARKRPVLRLIDHASKEVLTTSCRTAKRICPERRNAGNEVRDRRSQRFGIVRKSLQKSKPRVEAENGSARAWLDRSPDWSDLHTGTAHIRKRRVDRIEQEDIDRAAGWVSSEVSKDTLRKHRRRSEVCSIPRLNLKETFPGLLRAFSFIFVHRQIQIDKRKLRGSRLNFIDPNDPILVGQSDAQFMSR